MDAPHTQRRQSPQEILREILTLCADCDSCRFLMDVDCAFFPELYRLRDRERESGTAITDLQWRGLVELCTLCGLCPCPKIPIQVLEAKSHYIDQEGLSLAVRLLTDVPRLARLCGTFPALSNALQASRPIGNLLRKMLDVHPERQLPVFAEKSFFAWAKQQGLTGGKAETRTVAYFAGCTAGYLFPQVGRAVVEVLEHNGAKVYVPPQQCCGMPYLVEGARRSTLQRARYNLDRMLEVVRADVHLVCSCPSCGFFMRSVLLERAFYSEAYQRSVNAGEDEIKVPDSGRGDKKHKSFSKSIFKDILKDDGYFSGLNPMDRIRLSGQMFDVGEYLMQLSGEGRLDTCFDAVAERMVYFAPCHQREQKIGRPYLDLLARVPGLTIDLLGDSECCGMGGNFGFKTRFHDTSLALCRPLIEKIRKQNPQGIITDCMSCRLQFMHALPYPVYHPVEVLAKAYQSRLQS